MTINATLCLFAKPPRPGLTKTRLAATLGTEAAANVAQALLLDSLARFGNLAGIDTVLATTEPAAPEWSSLDGCEIWDQGSGDLGEKLERILRRALARTPVAIAIGADAPDLPPERIRIAIERLTGGVEAAIGPADDGGFHLLALRRCPEGLFSGLPWSAPSTFEATAERLRARGLRTSRLDSWSDIDEAADLECLRARLSSDEALRTELPRTWAALRALPRCAPTISVIVPTLDEAARIGDHLDQLLSLPGIGQRIVVDGGSSDATVAIARSKPGIEVLAAARGRARQMNAGAAAASGEILVFLHADALLPEDAAERVRRTLAEPGVVAGAFRIRTLAEGRRGWVRPLLRIADGRSHYSKIPYGDQAIFLRATTFHDLGGYPDQELMEDLELSRRLSRRGRIRIDDGEVRVSGRRFLARPIYYPLAINLFPLLYALGVTPARLARLYGDPR